MTAPITMSPDQVAARLEEFTVIDVRSPGEYASGHLPGALNIPLDRLDEALPALRAASAGGSLLMVCASGARSTRACAGLAATEIAAATLSGGTTAWANAGHELNHLAGARDVWPMERQVRLAAGGLVVLGLLAGLRVPHARWLSAGIGAGLVFSAISDTCGMAAVLSRLPHNRVEHGDEAFGAALKALHA